MSTVFDPNDIDALEEGLDEEIVVDPVEGAPDADADGDADADADEDEDDDDDINLLQQPQLTRADKTLEELLGLLDDPYFTPIIPDAVTDYYLAKNGLATADVQVKRLLALATQKFVSDIATDAYEYSRIRSNTAIHASNNPQTRARALLMATVANAKGDANLGDDGEQDPSASAALSNQNKEKVCLTMEDLSSALDEYGLNVNRPQFYR